MNFRSEIFQLCKNLVDKKETEEIKNLILNLCVHRQTEDASADVYAFPNKSDFGYVSKHSNNQFYGFLYTDENIETYKELFPKIKHLEDNEKKIISRGHATLMSLVNGCLLDVKKTYPSLYNAINPYSKYKQIKALSENSFLSEDELSQAITAFKNSKLYKKIFSSQIVDMFEALPAAKMNLLLGVMERDILQAPLDVVPDDIRDFSMRILNKVKDIQDVLFSEAILVLAMRESLFSACQLLYIALTGEKQIVLNNDNIISIEKSQSNSLYKMMTVLVDDILIRYSTELPGEILLIDCDPAENYHIHEFGVIRSVTISFAKETGQTTKVSFVTIDEEMNSLHMLTDTVIKAKFPPITRA